MNTNKEHQDVRDAEIDAALRNFRESIHAWSEQEYSRPRATQPARSGMWHLFANPIAGWALAAVVAIGGVAVPTAIHQQHQEQARRIADEQARQKLATDQAARQAALAMDDEELLSHVDSDIAQATPDAMEPLAELMISENQQGSTANSQKR